MARKESCRCGNPSRWPGIHPDGLSLPCRLSSWARPNAARTVPGLLQTEGYIRAITAASFPAAIDDFTERAVALRPARQQLLDRPDPPEYWVVLDETVLRRRRPKPCPAPSAGATCRQAATAADQSGPRRGDGGSRGGLGFQ